jgi:hypothetical protein
MAWESLHTDKEISLAHLGIIATHVRRIKSGAEYEKYFDAPTGENERIKDNATVHDTLAFVGVLVNKTLNDTRKIAQVLKRTTLEATCKSIFDFFYQHYQYKLDEFGIEQVRRPTRAWADRKTGIDCDCFSASVSSVLTNLGIAHHLKIIAIKNRPNYQHIYVVVPKQKGLDINSRANYWVIDPVLNSFDEEAPQITKTDYLKMNGIPLEQLNGIDDVAGLGNEFEGVENELNGLSDESVGRVFHQRLQQHIKNTRCHCQRYPQKYAHLYKPAVLVKQLQKLEGALESGNEAHLDGVLEELSNTEHEAVYPHLQGIYDALHGHDDYLYGQMYGDLDDKMLGAVLGLGRRGRSAKKLKNSKHGKRGFFTKIKNARKAFKNGKFRGKLKGAFKKIGRFIKKTNPLAIAIRGGFLMAMRTNFLKMAEKIYWGFQTRAFAMSKGINPDYYGACVRSKDRILKVFVDRLGGNESAIKKAIMNGRAAKKVAKLLKAKGMNGTTEELFGLGGLGSAAAAGASITAAMAVLAPIIKMMKGLFKGKKSGLEKNENGTESEAGSDNPSDAMSETESEARNPSNTTIDNDGSIESADNANDEPPSDDEDGVKKKVGASNRSSSGSANTSSNNSNTDTEEKNTASTAKEKDQGTTADENGNPKPATKSNTGLMIGIGAVGLIALGLMATSKKSTPQSALNGVNDIDGLGNFSTKRESKNLQKKLAKQGVLMPHGYEVKKRKIKKFKTIKI